MSFHREFDDRDNEKTAIPEGENASLNCIWVCEVFGPGEIDQLYDGLRSLGWDKGGFNSDRSVINWIKGQRQYGYGGWFNLGWVYRDRASILARSMVLESKFPKEFSSLTVGVHQICPSLTCLLVGFVLTEDKSKGYCAALNSRYKTTVTPIGEHRMFRFDQVADKKAKAITGMLNSVRELAIEWMQKNFTGYFASNSSTNRIPTGELISLVGVAAFENPIPQMRNWENWMRFLNLDSKIEYWQSKSERAYRFSLERRDGEFPNHLTIAVNWKSIPKTPHSKSEDSAIEDKAHDIHERIDGVFATFAANCFLKEVRRDATHTRESIRGARTTNVGHLSLLERIEVYFRRNIGVAIVAQELNKLSENVPSLEHNCGDFQLESSLQLSRSQIPTPLAKWFQYQLAKNAEGVLSESNDNRDYFQQLTTVLGTRENIRTQRWSFWLTILALSVAIASLLVAVKK